MAQLYTTAYDWMASSDSPTQQQITDILMASGFTCVAGASCHICSILRRFKMRPLYLALPLHRKHTVSFFSLLTPACTHRGRVFSFNAANHSLLIENNGVLNAAIATSVNV